MNERQILRTKLYTLASNLVDATGTVGEAHGDKKMGEVGLVGDVAAAVGEQLYESMEYVVATEKPTKEGLVEFLRGKKMSISWTVFSSGLKTRKFWLLRLSFITSRRYFPCTHVASEDVAPGTETSAAY